MSKVIAVSMVLVLAVGATTFGSVQDLVQQQGTQMAVNNGINLLHGSQTAASLQNLCVNNDQHIEGICHSRACETLLASIAQSGTAFGDCALIGLAQGLTVAGTQQQVVADGFGPSAEAQGLGMQACQSLARTDGSGGASGVHAVVLNAQQTAPAVSEGSSIIGLQTANVCGAPGSTSLVEGTMSVVTTQTQSN
jgi:hypothetical protein